MRVFKKIMYIILALVPVFPLLLFSVGNAGNTNGVDIIPMGSVAVNLESDEDLTSVLIVFEKDTFLYHALTSALPFSSYLTIGDVEITPDDVLSIAPGTYTVYNYNVPSDETEPFVIRIVRLYDWLVSVGITPPAFVVYALLYLVYLFFVQLLVALFDIVTFVPRKCSEIFGG